MTEFNPENPEIRPGPSAEDEAALKLAREQLQQADAHEVLTAKENAPQIPTLEKSFQVHPDSGHAEKVDQIIGQHIEAGIPLPNDIPEKERAPQLGKLLKFTPAQKAVKAEEIRNATNISPYSQMEGLAELIGDDSNPEHPQQEQKAA